jgi:hypothetical protein
VTTLMIEAELWVSFASVLRSYVAAASLHSATVFTVDSTESAISLRTDGAVLAFQVDPQNGAGYWQLNGSETSTQGRFILLHDGRIALDGKMLDLDHAAIDFAAALMQAASARQNP